MNEKPIYLCITPFFPSPSRWQGAYVLDQMKAIMRNSDFEVIVFKTNPLNCKEEDYEIDGIKVKVIRPLLMPSYILNGATENVVGRMFLRTLRNYGIDAQRIRYVHCHTTSHSAFGFGVKSVNPDARVIVQFHDLDPLTLRNGRWADKRWNRRYRTKKAISALNRADLLLCISEPVKDALLAFPQPREGEVFESARNMLEDVKDMPSLTPKRLYVLNNGVDTSLFHAVSKEKSSDVFRIGCIANFQELKDHRSLVEAFRLLIKKGHTNMRLSLLGTGETHPAIEMYLQEHGLEKYVEWPSEVQHDQLPAYYRSLDLFVLPSIFEGFGCVYTEAHACGVPFICCEHQGAAECIAEADRDKWLVEPRNAKQLAERIERYYNERYKQVLCKEYDIDKLIIGYLDFCKTL